MPGDVPGNADRGSGHSNDGGVPGTIIVIMTFDFVIILLGMMIILKKYFKSEKNIFHSSVTFLHRLRFYDFRPTLETGSKKKCTN